MNRTRALSAVLISFVLNTVLLMVSYPICREFRYQRYPARHWIEVYLGTGILVTLVVCLITTAIHVFLRQRSKARMVIVKIIASFATLSFLAVFVGMSNPYPSASWPMPFQYISAKFFAEVKFFTFIFFDAVPIALISGLLFAFVVGGFRPARLD